MVELLKSKVWPKGKKLVLLSLVDSWSKMKAFLTVGSSGNLRVVLHGLDGGWRWVEKVGGGLTEREKSKLVSALLGFSYRERKL